MDIYQVRPTTVGWELEDQQSHETVLRTPTKDEMYSAPDAFMDGRTASVEVIGRDGEVEEERPYPAAITCDAAGQFPSIRRSPAPGSLRPS